MHMTIHAQAQSVGWDLGSSDRARRLIGTLKALDKGRPAGRVVLEEKKLGEKINKKAMEETNNIIYRCVYHRYTVS